MNSKKNIIITGALIGIISVLLVKFGNPANMGFCIACFIRDTAGAFKLHNAATVQYVRPEIIGLVLGAFMMAAGKKEFKAKGGSSPFIRFILGFVVMVGALMFLGCPLRMVLRLAGGDFNAIIGLIGFICGIVLGIWFLNKGFSLKRNYKLNQFEGYAFPAINIVLLIALLSGASVLAFSKSGPGSMHAPILLSLAGGLIVGALAQRTRLCMVGGIRDLILFKDDYLISGFISIFVFAFIGNIIFGYFKPGFIGQPVAHNDALWNFLGMALTGWASVLLGGCPLRQLILSGEGNIDSVITILGMLLGAAFCHNFQLASSPKGPTPNGKIAVIIGFIVVLAVSYFNMEKTQNVKVKGDVKLEAN